RLIETLKPDVVLLNEICLHFGSGTEENKKKAISGFEDDVDKKLGYVCYSIAHSHKANSKGHWIRGSAILIRKENTSKFIDSDKFAFVKHGENHGFEIAEVKD
ncbi:hypothetical protein PFISCL1PPCAC_16891, partial [Pristionchus fissidentatus]